MGNQSMKYDLQRASSPQKVSDLSTEIPLTYDGPAKGIKLNYRTTINLPAVSKPLEPTKENIAPSHSKAPAPLPPAPLPEEFPTTIETTESGVLEQVPELEHVQIPEPVSVQVPESVQISEQVPEPAQVSEQVSELILEPENDENTLHTLVREPSALHTIPLKSTVTENSAEVEAAA